MIELVKIRDVNNKEIIKEVPKQLAGDFIGTGRFELVKDEQKKEYQLPKSKELK